MVRLQGKVPGCVVLAGQEQNCYGLVFGPSVSLKRRLWKNDSGRVVIRQDVVVAA